jgi:hypothetical protein
MLRRKEGGWDRRMEKIYVTRNFIVSIPCQILPHLNDQTKDEEVGRS